MDCQHQSMNADALLNPFTLVASGSMTTKYVPVGDSFLIHLSLHNKNLRTNVPVNTVCAQDHQ